MLKIQVLGKGLIPRGYGLAPRVNPFPADLTLIGTILNTNGLTVNYLNPETNKMCPLTKENLKKVYDKFGNKEVKTPERHLPGANAPQVKAAEAVATNVAPTAPTAPTGTPEAAPAVEEVTTPQVPEQQKPEETKTEESVEEKVAAPESTAAEEKVETVEEKKDEQPAAEPLKPINAPENKSQNNNSQNNNHQQNKGNNNNNNNRK